MAENFRAWLHKPPSVGEGCTTTSAVGETATGNPDLNQLSSQGGQHY